MERDTRRDPGQWRGCHVFKDISDPVGDDDQAAPQPGPLSSTAQKREGGLKMGQTYHYYYELNGSAEVHDPSLPSTNTCPSLPGQTVNTLNVPIERSSRNRSASLTSLRKADYMTMNPADKYTTPRAPPPVPSTRSPRVCTAAPTMANSATSPSHLSRSSPTRRSPPSPRSRTARSLSPSSSSSSDRRQPWLAKKFFRVRSKEREQDSSANVTTSPDTPAIVEEQASFMLGSERRSRSETASPMSGSSRTRDISPESLRLFLSNDIPSPISNQAGRPSVAIPEDIVEEAEDDDNFATSAVSDTTSFGTVLSPPPFQPSHFNNGLTSPYARSLSSQTSQAAESRAPSPDSFPSPTSFFDDWSDDEGDDDEYEAEVSSSTTGFRPLALNLKDSSPLLSTYSLPRSSDSDRLKTAGKEISSITSEPRADPPGILTAPPETGFDELVSELGWMVSYMESRPI